jgi:hypothetical protein
MATKLTKPVSRELKEWKRKGFVGLNGKDARRNLIVTLEPAGLFSFRLKGLQSEYVIDVERVFALAVKEAALKSIQDSKREEQIMKQSVS